MFHSEPSTSPASFAMPNGRRCRNRKAMLSIRSRSATGSEPMRCALPWRAWERLEPISRFPTSYSTSYRAFCHEDLECRAVHLPAHRRVRSVAIAGGIEAIGSVAGRPLDICRVWRALRPNVNRSVEQYNLHEGARHVYAFFWHEFCDWYLEMIKLHPERSKPTLLYVFESALTFAASVHAVHHGRAVAEHAAQGRIDRDCAVSGVWSRHCWMKVRRRRPNSFRKSSVKVRNIRSEMSVDAKQVVSLRIATSDKQLGAVLSDAPGLYFQTCSSWPNGHCSAAERQQAGGAGRGARFGDRSSAGRIDRC